MLTVNDIREITFNRSMSGYKTTEVDTFIDQCADTIAALTRSNAELEKKLEVLADKLVEYRNEEDSIRTALLSAQRLGDTVVREANHKAGLILEDAKIKADKIQENARRSIQEEERELERIRKEVTNFKSRLLSIYREHLAAIDILPEDKANDASEDQAEVTETSSETVTEQDVEPVAEKTEEPVVVQQSAPAEQNIAISDITGNIPDFHEQDREEAADVTPITVPTAVAEKETAPISRFSNLKFGDDYDISKDKDDSASFFRHHK